jgi:uncharacterized protein YjbJ (UPF0337 family)
MTDPKIDKAKGRVQRAAGALSGGQTPKNEGRVDQATGSTKKAVDKVGDTLTRPQPRSRSTRVRATRPTQTPGR